MTVKAKNVTSTEREQEYMEYVEGFGLTHLEAEVLSMAAVWLPELRAFKTHTKRIKKGSNHFKYRYHIPPRVASILRRGGVIINEREVDWGLVDEALVHPFVKAGVIVDEGLLCDRARDDSEP